MRKTVQVCTHVGPTTPEIFGNFVSDDQRLIAVYRAIGSWECAPGKEHLGGPAVAVQVFEEELKSQWNGNQLDLKEFFVDAGKSIDEKTADHVVVAVALVFAEDSLSIKYFHAGTVRLYLFRQGSMKQLTKDHSVVEAMIDEGRVKPKDLTAQSKAFRSMITHCVGNEVGDEKHLPLESGDRFLVTTIQLEDDQMTEVLASTQPLTKLKASTIETFAAVLIDIE